jgi:hypothetical protein
MAASWLKAEINLRGLPSLLTTLSSPWEAPVTDKNHTALGMGKPATECRHIMQNLKQRGCRKFDLHGVGHLLLRIKPYGYWGSVPDHHSAC